MKNRAERGFGGDLCCLVIISVLRLRWTGMPKQARVGSRCADSYFVSCSKPEMQEPAVFVVPRTRINPTDRG